MKLQEYVVKDEKKMSYGYTTGSCAAGAAGAAFQMLLSGKQVDYINLQTPKGISLTLETEDVDMHLPDYVSCAVRKDAGDDPDVTHGALVYAKVSLREEKGMEVIGGIGVGRVTKPGLDQPVGEAAINSGPRRQIREKIEELCKLHNYKGGVSITISIPQGIELAEKTFNPRIGIEGGISVLGTSGIVEPMSDQALIDTIRVELNMHRAQGEKKIAIAPGNYGLQFMKQQYDYELDKAVKCSNFIKDSMEMAAEMGYERILFTGHLGKLIKVAAGTGNTHSKYGDGRMEMLAALAAQHGVEEALIKEIQHCVATDEVVRILGEAGMRDAVMSQAAELVKYHTEKFTGQRVNVEVILFSNEYGLLAKTAQAEALLQELKGQ